MSAFAFRSSHKASAAHSIFALSIGCSLLVDWLVGWLCSTSALSSSFVINVVAKGFSCVLKITDNVINRMPKCYISMANACSVGVLDACVYICNADSVHHVIRITTQTQ